MPLRLGVGQGLVNRVRQRMQQALPGQGPAGQGPSGQGPFEVGDGGDGQGPADFPEEPHAPSRYRRRNRQSRPSGADDIRVRIREAVNQDPPKLCWATYKMKGATDFKPRFLACYSERDRAADGGALMFAACSADSWAIEAFDYRRFGDFQVTDDPWPFQPLYRIEFQDPAAAQGRRRRRAPGSAAAPGTGGGGGR